MSAGFADPARQTQRAFRAILEALARPTRPIPIVGPEHPPAPLSSAVAAVGLTLCDEDTPVFLDAPLAADGAVAAWFAFYTGAPVISDPAAASFVFATGFAGLPPLTELAAGTPEQPDRSATVVLDLGRHDPATERLRATGPGIDGSARFAAPAGFADVWRRNTARFPMGVDLLLVEAAQVRGLPRTTRLAYPTKLAYPTRLEGAARCTWPSRAASGRSPTRTRCSPGAAGVTLPCRSWTPGRWPVSSAAWSRG